MSRKSRTAPARLEGEVPLFDEAGEPVDLEGMHYSDSPAVIGLETRSGGSR